MYSQCQQNHDDIHETSSSSSSSSTVTLCLYSIGYLVTIGCDHSNLSICLHSVDSCIHFHRWKGGVFTVTKSFMNEV